MRYLKKYNGKKGWLNLFKYIVKTVTAILTVMMLFASCSVNTAGPQQNPSSVSQAYYSFTDDTGASVILTKQPEHVVSLSGSFAETWVLAGGAGSLAGTTEDAVSERNLSLPSDVKIIGTIKDPNTELVISLSPDFVLLSADIDSHLKISSTLVQLGIPYAFFKVEYFDDYLRMLKICTDITGRPDLYEKNGAGIRAEIEAIKAKYRNRQGPSVLFIRAYSTGAKAKTGDNMTGRMLADLGCDNIASRYPSMLESISMEAVIMEDPGFILVTTMGESTEKAIAALESSLASNPAWAGLSAVKNGSYIILPKELFHYKPNARWAEAYKYLAEILYGE